jgi:predicted transcriptional regulator
VCAEKRLLVHSLTNTVKNQNALTFCEDDAQLKLNNTLIAFFLILIIAVSFATLIQKQKNTAFSIAAAKNASPMAFLNSIDCDTLTAPMLTQQFPAALSQANVAERPTTVFNNSTRAEIYSFIKANPGVQFRGICAQLGISIGVAEFHLGVLKKAGLISFFRDGRYKRFFESKKFSQKQMQLISLLRHGTTRSIIKTMLDGKQVSHSELSSQLDITSQGVTWQINRLRQDDIIQESKDGMKLNYTLENTYAPMLTELVNLIEQP